MQSERRGALGRAALAVGLTLAAREALARWHEADLRGQVALVAGGSRGLGLLIARELAGQGCRLAICARDGEELERARADLETRGAEVLTVVCDVGSRQQVEQMVERVRERFGRIDLLVNVAGVIQVGPYESMRLEDYQEALDVMFWGVVYPTLAVVPEMRRRGAGRIVNITSIGGRVAVPHLLPYCSAKFAAVGFSQGLRAELARDGIQVTTIVPGLMRTGSGFNAYFKGQREKEFGLFGALASLPPASMDAERAARQIVQALRRGEAERVLSLPALLLDRAHGLLPGLTTDLMGLVNRVLPTAPADDGRRERGLELYERTRSRLLDGLLVWSRSAARRFNELPGPVAAGAAPAAPAGGNVGERPAI